ncbi:protein SHQ1 homolog [Pollicipes pollicipes]|uniref:protein SHQ1 homolog n=1 Tax=Pollicipes pollicipes TaxID=41117 RepID=UPI0018857350|nr:protein SHQ1 homolog [Pollicipes pollicipes]
MLTPRFSITQDDEHVVIEVEAPFAHVKETEVFMEGNLFTFHSAPYYLRLHFSGCIVENDKASAKFDPDKKGFIVHAPKVTRGETFKNLDMLTALLTPGGVRNVSKTIEELGDEAGFESHDDVGSEIDWFVTQEMPSNDEVCIGSRYGFANQHIGVFTRLQSELGEVIDVQDPDSKSALERSSERKSQESNDFNDDHYLADTMEEEETMGHLIQLTPAEVLGTDGLTQEQKDDMIKLKPQSFTMNACDLREAGLTLVDVLFAYCYDKRATGGESSVESGWCIAKLSSSLSWLERHSNLKDTVVTCMRRSLCYPLFRNWRLSSLVLDDTRWLFSRGRKHLLKALLDVRRMLLESDPRYILNQLYVDDMCVWIQHVDEAVIAGLSDALKSLSLDKCDVNLDLDELEAAANMVLQEGQMSGKDITDTLHGLTLDSDDSSDDDSDDSTSDGSSSETDSDAESSGDGAELQKDEETKCSS